MSPVVTIIGFHFALGAHLVAVQIRPCTQASNCVFAPPRAPFRMPLHGKDILDFSDETV